MSRLAKDATFPVRGLLTELINESSKRPQANFLEHVKYNANGFTNLCSNLKIFHYDSGMTAGRFRLQSRN
jgi:hypothetical protein